MTAKQAAKVHKLAVRIENLTNAGLDALNDDPMTGEVWSAFNRMLGEVSEIQRLASLTPSEN